MLAVLPTLLGYFLQISQEMFCHLVMQTCLFWLLVCVLSYFLMLIKRSKYYRKSTMFIVHCGSRAACTVWFEHSVTWRYDNWILFLGIILFVG